MESNAIDSHEVTVLLKMIENVLNTSAEPRICKLLEPHHTQWLCEDADMYGVGTAAMSYDDGTSSNCLLPTPTEVPRVVNGDIRKRCVIPQWELQAPHNSMTLPDISKLLDQEIRERILCVKKIHKLGFRSARYLRQHFSQFGAIDKLVLLPSRQKEATAFNGYGSPVRPASMCFIVMAAEMSAQLALSQELHYVSECPIEVAAYTPPSFNDAEAKYTDMRSRSSSLSSFETDVSN